MKDVITITHAKKVVIPNIKVIRMKEVEYCLICSKFIGAGNDPALCDSERCKTIFEYESAFNRFAAEEVEKEKKMRIERKESPELICPNCNHFPLTLSGRVPGLTLEIEDGMAQCPNCSYQQEF